MCLIFRTILIGNRNKNNVVYEITTIEHESKCRFSFFPNQIHKITFKSKQTGRCGVFRPKNEWILVKYSNKLEIQGIFCWLKWTRKWRQNWNIPNSQIFGYDWNQTTHWKGITHLCHMRSLKVESEFILFHIWVCYKKNAFHWMISMEKYHSIHPQNLINSKNVSIVNFSIDGEKTQACSPKKWHFSIKYVIDFETFNDRFLGLDNACHLNKSGNLIYLWFS